MIEFIQKLTPIAWDDVQVRDPRASDVELIVDYFYEKTRPLPFQQFDRSKFVTEEQMRERYRQGFANPEHKFPVCIVDYRGRPIGMHTLTPLHPTHSDFHAHFWEVDLRGKKIALVSWYKACDLFFKRFGFERLFFKPPVDNPYSSRAIRPLHLRQLPNEILDYPQLIPGVEAHVYEITREEFYALK